MSMPRIEKTYTLYFEFFGRKMKMRVNAESKLAAQQKVIDRISFHKIVEHDSTWNEAADIMNNLSDFLNKKP